jgi:beta-xylosidase
MISTLLTAALAANTALFGLANAAATPRLGGQNFPDPSVIRADDGWRAYATEVTVDGKKVYVPMAYTRDWKTWTFRGQKDAMPKLAPWINKAHPRVWAPDIVALPGGKYILYYSAALQSNGAIHCLGYATSNNIEGPFVDNSAQPWICPVKQGGAIDISGFYDTKKNKRYVVYKVDGNAIGHGGECGNTIKPIVPTPNLIQQVDVNNGFSMIGTVLKILSNDDEVADGPYVEAPALNYMSGKYVLFYSPQCYTTPKYSVSYAIADQITGPYIRSGVLFKTGGPLGFQAPGGLDVAVNGDHAVWHAYVYPFPFDGHETIANLDIRNYGTGRALYTGILTLKNGKITAQVD